MFTDGCINSVQANKTFEMVETYRRQFAELQKSATELAKISTQDTSMEVGVIIML